MKEILDLEPIRQAPKQRVVLARLGVPEGHEVSGRVQKLAEKSRALYESLAEPRGIVVDIPLPEFREIYAGEGNNASPAPIPGIVEQADGLALFVATVGGAISDRIEELFQENDPATACMLDGIASERAEMATVLLAETFLGKLRQQKKLNREARALSYSPGYCGWDITGQRALFSRLKPERIGITLSETCLMSPIKSVSGVLVVGAPDIHDFENEFEFCLDCANWECRSRIASLFGSSQTEE